MFKRIRSRLLLRIMESRPYAWLLEKVIPYIRFTTYYPNFPGEKFYVAYDLIKPGDIVLTTDNKKLTTVLIGGEMTHACLCVSKDRVWEISEMTHENYHRTTFFDVCKEATRIIILRCPDFDAAYIDAMIAKCKTFVDATYDIEFDLGVKALYCSELVYQSDFERRLQVSLEDLAGLGRQYISPTGLLHAKNVNVVFDSGAK